MRRAARAAGLLVCLHLVVACATSSPRPDAAALRERAAKEEAALLKRVRLHADPRLDESLAGIARRVGAADGARVVVLEDPTLGAFAMPTGRIFVTTGLLSALGSEAQVATILARELAHDTSRLSPAARTPPMGTVALGPTAAAILGLDLQLAGAAAIDGYGPGDERMADVDAIRRLGTAGYDVREAAAAFERLGADRDHRGGLLEIFFYARIRDGSAGEPSAAPDDGIARILDAVARDNAGLDARAGRFALARRRLDRVLAQNPDDAVAHVRYGDLLRLASQRAPGPERAEGVRGAAMHYQRARELDPRSAEPLRQLALLYYQEGDEARARAAFERYLALKPDAEDAARVREYLAFLPRGGTEP